MAPTIVVVANKEAAVTAVEEAAGTTEEAAATTEEEEEEVVTAAPEAAVAAAASESAHAVDADSSDTSLQEYYMNRERENLESVADRTAQRECVSKYMLQMKYSSPGNAPFAETVIYSPGKRPYLHSPHPFVVISKELRDPIMEEADESILYWNSHNIIRDDIVYEE